MKQKYWSFSYGKLERVSRDVLAQNLRTFRHHHNFLVLGRHTRNYRFYVMTGSIQDLQSRGIYIGQIAANIADLMPTLRQYYTWKDGV